MRCAAPLLRAAPHRGRLRADPHGAHMPTMMRIYQSTTTRRQASALLLWLREVDPTAGIGDLIELVLVAALNARGVVPRLPARYHAGRPSSVDPTAAIARDLLPVRGGRRSLPLLAQAREVINGSTAALWHDAVAELYGSITAPVSADDLGPLAGVWVAQGSQGPLEAAA